MAASVPVYYVKPMAASGPCVACAVLFQAHTRWAQAVALQWFTQSASPRGCHTSVPSQDQLLQQVLGPCCQLPPDPLSAGLVCGSAGSPYYGLGFLAQGPLGFGVKPLAAGWQHG